MYKRNVISTMWEFGGFCIVDLHVLGSFKQGGSLSLSAMNVKLLCKLSIYIAAFLYYNLNGRNIDGLFSNNGLLCINVCRNCNKYKKKFLCLFVEGFYQKVA